MASSSCFAFFASWVLAFVVLTGFAGCIASQIGLGSRFLASKGLTWVSDNSTFAFGFAAADTDDRMRELGIWFAEIPRDHPTMVWSANRESPVSNAILERDTTGNLVLMDGGIPIWTSNTFGGGVEAAVMAESGNFILYNTNNHPAWQSFSQPSDTLLPNQLLTDSSELTSSKSPSHSGYYVSH
ncbi:hypothetical protein L6164_008777 [Bauhinia variegata]|uniref:Uncharacterized protein n=1 Tax=Bauhinia variegata TaxID=167791 RepID=A0ACB9PGN0_BAUVA|nr:hypothetical protein L6164_008777 [Bauhinia variegata]